MFTVSSAVFHLRFMLIIWISSANHQNIIWKSCVNCELLFDDFFSQTYFTQNTRQDTYTATSHQGGAEVASSNHNLWTWGVGGRVQLATRGIGWVHCWCLLIIVTIYVCTYDSLLNVCSVNFCCTKCVYILQYTVYTHAFVFLVGIAPHTLLIVSPTSPELCSFPIWSPYMKIHHPKLLRC